VLYDALHLGYDREVPIYRYRLSMVDSLDICETSVTIPLNPVEPWTGTIFGSVPNTTVEQTAHVALTSEPHRRYRNDGHRAFPDLESGKSHVEAAPDGHV
jgi:hypothetical protein